MKYIYGAIIRADEEDGGFWAEVPDLPGCFGSGGTFVETVTSISDGVETHLAALIEDGRAIPPASKVEADDGEVVYVYADLDGFALTGASVTASEAARRLGVSAGRVSQLISDGRLDAVRMANVTLVSVDSIVRYSSEPRKVGRPRRELVQ